MEKYTAWTMLRIFATILTSKEKHFSKHFLTKKEVWNKMLSGEIQGNTSVFLISRKQVVEDLLHANLGLVWKQIKHGIQISDGPFDMAINVFHKGCGHKVAYSPSREEAQDWFKLVLRIDCYNGNLYGIQLKTVTPFTPKKIKKINDEKCPRERDLILP